VFQNPTDLISMNDALLLRFVTDSTVVSKGFSASYIAVESLGAGSEYSSSHIDKDDVDLAFGKNANKTKKPPTAGGRGDEDEDVDDYDDGEGMLAAKGP